MAVDLGLNVIVHQRAAYATALEVFQPFAVRVRGVFHCFVGTMAEVRELAALGSLVSFTGILTFKNAQTIRDTLGATPPGAFMLETDCPYLAPVPYRGKRCEPAYVKELAAAVAQVQGCTLEELSAATCQTAREFFPKLR